MKRFYVLAFVLLLNITLSAQNRGLLLKETFDSSELPEGWYIDGHEENWSVSTSSKAGGDPNEMYLTWSPVFVDVSRLVMPAFDFTGISSVEVSFNHFHDNYTDPIAFCAGQYRVTRLSRNKGIPDYFLTLLNRL